METRHRYVIEAIREIYRLIALALVVYILVLFVALAFGFSEMAAELIAFIDTVAVLLIALYTEELIKK